MKKYLILLTLFCTNYALFGQQIMGEHFPFRFQFGAGLFAGNYLGRQVHIGAIHKGGLTVHIQFSEQVRRAADIPEEIECDLIPLFQIAGPPICPRNRLKAMELLSGYYFRFPQSPKKARFIHLQGGLFFGDFREDINIEITGRREVFLSSYSTFEYQSNNRFVTGLVLRPKFGFERQGVGAISLSPQLYLHSYDISWGIDMSFIFQIPSMKGWLK